MKRKYKTPDQLVKERIKKRKTTVSLPYEIFNTLKLISTKSNADMSMIIEEALKMYFETVPAKYK